MTTRTPTHSPSRAFLLMAAGGLIATLATLGVFYTLGWLAAAPAAAPTMDHQAMNHDSGQTVMPFDLTKTTHVFEMTQSGGVQQVVAKEANDQQQIGLIRQHLQHEAAQFKAGDFGDPATLHGDDMLGLRELTAGAASISIAYTELPDGAQITYTTDDIALVTALHQWFGAQLSDHGTDATTR